MSNPYQPPPGGLNYQPPGSGEGDVTGGVIPYKNPKALTAYYIGIVSLLCCFAGLPVGIVAVVLGIMGLNARAANPVIKGSVHAWIGIVLGMISTLGAVFFAFNWIIVVMASANRH
jgi:hypothetical protein